MKKQVRDALRTLFQRDAHLLEGDAAERTISARLARYLEPLFPGYRADPEYNRHGFDPKRVTLPKRYRRGGRIFPDIVIHQRGADGDNLLVIQIKKETNREPRDRDRAIIRAMMRQLHYTHGLLMDLPAGPGSINRRPRLEWL